MDDDYDDNEGFAVFVPGPPPTRRFVLVDLLVLSLHFVSEVAGAFHSTSVAAYNIAAQHANYRVDQRDFREQAARDIETLTTTGEPDDG